jgi:hypothetical protein
MYWDVVEVKPELDYCLFLCDLRWTDGACAVAARRADRCPRATAEYAVFRARHHLIAAQSLGPVRWIWRRMQCTLRSLASAIKPQQAGPAERRR